MTDADPLARMGYDPGRSTWISTWQTEPCSRCGQEVDDSGPHWCVLDPAAHADHGPNCPFRSSPPADFPTAGGAPKDGAA